MNSLKIKDLCRRMTVGVVGMALASTALGQLLPTTSGNANMNINSFLSTEDEVAYSAKAPSKFVRRAPPPVPGGGCQANGDFSDATGAFIGVAINPAAFMRADNFRPAGTGPVSLTAVSWTGWSQQGTAPAITSAAVPTSFQITVFNDFQGFPGTQIGASQTVTPTATASTETVLPGNTPIALTDFSVTLPNAVSLTAGTCYWIEIRPAAAPAAGVTYLWRSSDQGDGVNYRRTSTATPYANTGIRTTDFSFCTNLPLQAQSANACTPNSTMTCASPSQTACQVYDGTGLANFSTKAPLIGGNITFRSADNFSVNAATTVSGGCFQGVVVLQTGQTLPAAAADSFDITVYSDAGGALSGVPGTVIATRTVTPTDGALTRGVAVTSAFANSFNWSFNLASHSQGPIAIPAAGCYWIEVVYNDPAIRWAWLIKSNARATGLADDFRQTQASTVNGGVYDLLSQQFSGDFVWCIQGTGSTLVRSTTCGQVPAQTNTSCSVATTLALNGATVFGHNLQEVPPTAAIPFSCVSNVPNRNGLWYRVVGNGEDVTISTCNTGSNPLAANTNFDTVISVYCTRGTAPNECDGPFVCIGTNDDVANCGATTAGASSITFPTVSGQVYYAYVYGFEAGNGAIDTGFFYVNASASGTPSNPAAIACSNVTNCTIDIPAGAVFETDACADASTNSNCTTASPLALSTVGTGRISNTGATRDFDFWRLPDVNEPSGGRWFNIDFRTEFPGFIQIGRGTCTADAVPLVQLGINACSSANDFNIFVPNGEFYVNFSVNSFDNFGCTGLPNDIGNRYWVKVTPVTAVGACCVTGTACFVSVRDNAVVGGTEPADCQSSGGFYLGDGTVCDPNGSNAPCDPAGGAPAGAIVGSCCLSFGGCTLTIDTTCTGGLFTAAGVCDPNTCAAPVATCCFPTGTCLITADAAACTSAGGTAQATLRPCTPNACPVAPTGGCCSASFACSTTTQAACVGTWLGANVACTPTNCAPPPAGVCCRGATCNATIVQASCTSTGTAGSAFASASSTCNAIGSTTTPCCYADYNKVLGIEVNDIFDFLNDWFAGSNFADTGGDGTTAPDVNSIFDFLNAWFAGGC